MCKPSGGRRVPCGCVWRLAKNPRNIVRAQLDGTLGNFRMLA